MFETFQYEEYDTEGNAKDDLRFSHLLAIAENNDRFIQIHNAYLLGYMVGKGLFDVNNTEILPREKDNIITFPR